MQWEGHGVVVVPHEGRRSCAAHELAPVPASYVSARRRAVRLQADVKAFERAAGCLPPAEFARRLTRELRAGGWFGWEAVPRGGEGPCGRVSVATGSELLGSIGPAVDAQQRTIAVAASPPLELEEVVYGADSPGVSLFDSSGARCYTTPSSSSTYARPWRRRVSRSELHRRASGAEHRHRRRDRAADRYAEGCAIFAGASIRFPDGRGEILVELNRRD